MAYVKKKTRPRSRARSTIARVRPKRTVDETRIDPPRINVFVSYAREDDELVGRLVTLFAETFKLAPISFLRDVEIKQGVNYQSAIENALDETNILLVVFTQRLKISHSWTGFEVGYFRNSVRQSPKGNRGIDRIYLPLCIGAEIPDTLHYIQGVSISNDEVYKVMRTTIDAGAPPIVPAKHPLFQLLRRIFDIVTQALGSGNSEFGQDILPEKWLAKPASDLYLIIHDYLQSRVFMETYPERKLTIRTISRPTIENDGVDLSAASVELVGDFSSIFEISPLSSTGHEYNWADFTQSIPVELRANTVAGIRRLIANVLGNTGDNYHVVTTVARDKVFRLFVSKVVTYVSKKTEIDIYIVQMRRKEYGDPTTTRLLKAIEVGLRFRFLVLEDQSKFRPEAMGHPIVSCEGLKSEIVELLVELDLILREAVQANLRDPEFLILIWGKGREDDVKAMDELWEVTLRRLYMASEEVLNARDDDSFSGKRSEFINALIEFRGSIGKMNREFTGHALSCLIKVAGLKLEDQSAANRAGPENISTAADTGEVAPRQDAPQGVERQSN